MLLCFVLEITIDWKVILFYFDPTLFFLILINKQINEWMNEWMNEYLMPVLILNHFHYDHPSNLTLISLQNIFQCGCLWNAQLWECSVVEGDRIKIETIIS